MTPEQVKKARRIIGKRWYYRYRAWVMRKMFRYTDRALWSTDMGDLKSLCQLLERYANKEAWYAKKLNRNAK